MPEVDPRAERGAAYLATLDSGLEEALRKGMAPVAPDFADMMVLFGYGEMMV